MKRLEAGDQIIHVITLTLIAITLIIGIPAQVNAQQVEIDTLTVWLDP